MAFNVLGGVREGTGPVETLRKSPPSVLRKLCEKMGATYIKVRVCVWDRFDERKCELSQFPVPSLLSVSFVDAAGIEVRDVLQHFEAWNEGVFVFPLICLPSLSLALSPYTQLLTHFHLLAHPVPSSMAFILQVGQFIASSPTLFPADYVKEFQKCLDKTDSIPWSESVRSTRMPEFPP